MAACFAADTSVIVASLLTWHEHHAPSRRALETAMDDAPLVIPVPALVESYAVLTRLPAPHRLSPRDAHVLLRENFAHWEHGLVAFKLPLDQPELPLSV